jgi:uncharacterized protein YfiM (DUF2279 family)
MVRQLLLLLACGVLFAPFASAAAAPSLDGRAFAIALVEDGSGKDQGKDVLAFAGGQGECQNAGRKYGYAKGMCTVTKTKDRLAFRFAMTSAEHGELVFEGVVHGKTVQGTRTWSKPGKTPIVHRFSGQQQ